MDKKTMEDLELYELFINEKANERSNELLPNAGEDHAAVAFSQLFKRTSSIVRMVVGSFDGRISDQKKYIESLKDCLDKDVKFKIIFLDEVNKNSEAYNLLLKYENKGQVSFAKASEKFKKRLTVDGKEKHFAIFDSDKFRFEKDTSKYIALFGFNNPSECSNLINIFDSEFKAS